MPNYSTENFNNYWNDVESSGMNAAESYKKAMESAAEGAYKGTMLTLGNEESALKNLYPVQQQELQTSINAQMTPLYQGKEEELYGLGQQEKVLNKNTKGAINTAGKVFNELATMIPKYSGTSAAGAVGEILGRSTAEKIGEAKQTLTEGMQTIGETKDRVVRFYQQKLSDVQAQGAVQLRKLQTDFNNAIDKINTLRRVAEEDKKALRLQALYNFQGKISELQQGISESKFALEKWVYEKNQEISNRVGPSVPTWSLNDLINAGNSLREAGVPADQVSNWIKSNVGKTDAEVSSGYSDLYGQIKAQQGEGNWGSFIQPLQLDESGDFSSNQSGLSQNPGDVSSGINFVFGTNPFGQ